MLGEQPTRDEAERAGGASSRVRMEQAGADGAKAESGDVGDAAKARVAEEIEEADKLMSVKLMLEVGDRWAGNEREFEDKLVITSKAVDDELRVRVGA